MIVKTNDNKNKVIRTTFGLILIPAILNTNIITNQYNVDIGSVPVYAQSESNNIISNVSGVASESEKHRVDLNIKLNVTDDLASRRNKIQLRIPVTNNVEIKGNYNNLIANGTKIYINRGGESIEVGSVQNDTITFSKKPSDLNLVSFNIEINTPIRVKKGYTSSSNTTYSEKFIITFGTDTAEFIVNNLPALPLKPTLDTISSSISILKNNNGYNIDYSSTPTLMRKGDQLEITYNLPQGMEYGGWAYKERQYFQVDLLSYKSTMENSDIFYEKNKRVSPTDVNVDVSPDKRTIVHTFTNPINLDSEYDRFMTNSYFNFKLVDPSIVNSSTGALKDPIEVTIKNKTRDITKKTSLGRVSIPKSIIDGDGELKPIPQIKKTVTTEIIEYNTEYRETEEWPLGREEVIQNGVDGEKTITTITTFLNGVKQSEDKEEEITKKPTPKIIQKGIGKVNNKIDKKTEPISFETIYRDNPNLPEGQEKEIQPGEEGVLTYYKETPMFNGQPVGEPKERSERTKEPVNRIVERGTGIVGEKEEKQLIPVPFETERRENPELPAGEERVIQEGVQGEITRITKTPTLNGIPSGEPVSQENQTKDPVNRIVEVGTGVLVPDAIIRTEQEPIPYKTELRENPELPDGERNVVQKGVEGLKEVTYIATTLNGKPIAEPTREERIAVEPIDEIIEVGIGLVGEIEDRQMIELPYETERHENLNLPEGVENVIQEGETGTKEIVTKQPTLNGQPVGNPTITENVIKEPIKRIIEVGTGNIGEIVEVNEIKTPFEVERHENINLDPGTERIVQEGQDGLVRITKTTPTLNGVVNGEPVISESVITEVKNQIIEYAPDKIEDVPFETERRENPELPEGEERIVREGKPGRKINGKVVEEPVSRIVEVGTKKPDVEEEIQFETERRENPDLPEGEERVIREGKPGRKINGKIVEEPVSRIVEVGTKKPDVEEEVPFEVEKRDNPNLPEGEERVVQEGKPGRKVNGKVVEEPVNKIVEVGAKKPAQDRNKPDVKTGVSDIATNPTLLTTLGLTITGILSAIGIKKRKDN